MSIPVQHLFYWVLLTLFLKNETTADSVSFRNVKLKIYNSDPVIIIRGSNNLKKHLPKFFVHTAVVAGYVPILYENSVTDIDNVQNLYFCDNGMEEIEPGAFKNFTSVTALTIDGNKLSYFEEGVFDDLRVINLQISNNPIKTVTNTTFGNLSSLSLLNLGNNRIQTIEENSFDNLINLEYLFLERNRIRYLSYGLFKNLPKLNQLSIEDNELQHAGEKVFESPSLEILDLTNNSIYVISEDLFKFLPKLRVATFSYNQVKRIRKGTFTNQLLQHVKLDHNLIFYIYPQTFTDMPNLETLDLSNNELYDYDASWFYNTTNLEQLFLGSNFIRDLPDGMFQNVYNDKSQWLKLDNNTIQQISPKVFKGMRRIYHLDLSHNKLELWDDQILDTDDIVFLHLDFNKLKCVSGDLDKVFRANTTFLNNNQLSGECIKKLKQWQENNPNKNINLHQRGLKDGSY